MIVLGVGQEPLILNEFKVRGSDGKRYTLESLTAGKPALVFYLNSGLREIRAKNAGEQPSYKPHGFERPTGVADINRLSSMTKGKLRVFAVTFASGEDMVAQVRRSGLKVPLLGHDGDGYSAHSLIDQMLKGHRRRNLCHLQNILIIPNPGREARIWSGYSRASLGDMQRLVAKYTGVKLGLDLSRFPKSTQAGGTMMFGLPGP